MATASLGTLTVQIGADTRKLKEGERVAKASLGRIESQMQRIGAVATRMAGALAAAFTVQSIANFTKEIIDSADQMTKLARSAGTTVETLTALGHAASLSGMSVEELARAFRNVARNANASLKGPSDFSRSLDALGVAWRDAEGNIRSADAIMLDVANRFEHMEDGATKTALAMRIFGEEMGPKLINMLNQGADGIRELTRDAERMGIVIDQKTGEAAERLNDALTRMGAASRGVAMRITTALIPTLERLAAVLENIATGHKSLEDLPLAALEQRLARLTENAERLNASLNDPTVAAGLKARQEQELERTNRLIAAIREQIAARRELAEWEAVVEPTIGDDNVEQTNTNQRSDALQRLNEMIRENNSLLMEGRFITESLQQPNERLASELERIGELYHHMAISADTAARAQTAAAALAANAYTGLAANVATSLSKIFNKNKAVAIAAAIANTAESITKTLAQYGGTPWGWANAAAAAAAGAAQIATIRRTSPSGGGTAPSTPTGGAVTPPAQPVDQTTRSPSTVLQVETIGVGNLITREAFEKILEQIMDYQRDGGTIILERV